MKIQCDVCNKDDASVFCTADEAALCDTCDHRVHHANKLASKHQRFSLIHPSSKQLPVCDICQVCLLICILPINPEKDQTFNLWIHCLICDDWWVCLGFFFYLGFFFLIYRREELSCFVRRTERCYAESATFRFTRPTSTPRSTADFFSQGSSSLLHLRFTHLHPRPLQQLALNLLTLLLLIQSLNL